MTEKPLDEDATDLPGFTYEVSAEQMARFATATIEQRLQWLEDMKQWSWDNASAEARASWAALRARK